MQVTLMEFCGTSHQCTNYKLQITCYTFHIFHIPYATSMVCSKNICSFLADVSISNSKPLHYMVLVSSAFLQFTQMLHFVIAGKCKTVPGPNCTWCYKGIWKSGNISMNCESQHQMAVCKSASCSRQFITVGGHNT